jgi:heme A synthase
VLGITTILFHVPLALALAHQAAGVFTFAVMVVANHQLLREGNLAGI